MKFYGVFKLPNAIISNCDNLHASTIRVAAVLYANMNKHRGFTNSIEHIATLAHCCKDTVCQAVEELERAGYLQRFQNYTYSKKHGRSIYAQTTYRIIHSVETDYTLVPYAWLRINLTHCSFHVLLSCRMFMIEEQNRSYASIRKIAALIGVGKSTVCQAIKMIAALGILIVERCKKENGAYTSNSYHMVKHSCKKAVELLTGIHSQQLPKPANCLTTENQRTPISLYEYSITYGTTFQCALWSGFLQT